MGYTVHGVAESRTQINHRLQVNNKASTTGTKESLNPAVWMNSTPHRHHHVMYLGLYPFRHEQAGRKSRVPSLVGPARG